MEEIQESERSKQGLELQHYWLSVREGNEIPGREQFDVLGISDLLPVLMVIETGSPADKTMKIIMAGSTYRDQAGFDLTGLDVADIFGNVDRETLWEYVYRSIKTPCGIVQRNVAEYAEMSNTTIEITMLPLAGNLNKPDLIVATTTRVGFSDDHNIHEPVALKASGKWSWIDLGYGIPEKA